MDVAIINPCVDSVITTMSMMCNLNVQISNMNVKVAGEDSLGDISGVIGFVGSLHGLIAVTFPKCIAVQAIGSMIGEVYTEIDDDILDGTGELTNIIAGNAKTIFKERGWDVSISLPSIMVGEGHSISIPQSIMSVVVEFKAGSQPFWLEIALRHDQS